MKISVHTVGPLQENSYLVVDDKSRRAVLVDPGDEPDRLLAAVRAAGATLEGVWLTHAHVDHVGGVAGVVRATDVPVWLHPLDEPLYRSAVKHGRMFGLDIEAPPPADRTLAEGDTLTVGELQFKVMHVPGHSPGHVAIHGHGVAFAGDCLFAGSIGRSDLPLSDPRALARSLERIVALGDAVTVYPGHGPSTTIGLERETNPFLAGQARIVGAW